MLVHMLWDLVVSKIHGASPALIYVNEWSGGRVRGASVVVVALFCFHRLFPRSSADGMIHDYHFGAASPISCISLWSEHY